MKTKLAFFAASVGLVACASSASAPTQAPPSAAASSAVPAGERDCFNVRMVNGFSAVDDRTVRLSAGANRNYDVSVLGAGCFDLDWANSIAIVAGSGSRLCVGDRLSGAKLLTDAGEVCRVNAIARAPDDAQAHAVEAAVPTK